MDPTRQVEPVVTIGISAAGGGTVGKAYADNQWIYRLDFVDGGGTRHDVEEIWVSSEAQAVAWARTRWSQWRPRGEKFVRVWRIGEGGEADRLVATVDGGW